MSDANGNPCLEIGPDCTIEETTYGYYPSLPANAFFAAIFGALLIIQLFQGVKWKSWTYLIALAFGCLGEAIGHVGRILLHNNPWDSTGFNMQITCLIIAPAFLSAAIYLTLKHIVLMVGPQYSRLPARWYTWIFITCDLLSLVLQGAGGGTAATADDDQPDQQALGTNLMIAGIVFQVVTLLIFGGLAARYAMNAYRGRSQFSQSTVAILHDTRFKLFLISLIVAYTTIFIRCVYRIAELAGGWGNSIMQKEDEYIVLDSVMIMIATLCLTIFHPGYCFPQMQMKNKHSVEGNTKEPKQISDLESR